MNILILGPNYIHPPKCFVHLPQKLRFDMCQADLLNQVQN